MKFIADEGVDAQIVYALREKNYEVIYIAEVDAGITDEQVLEYANQGNAILMTRDKDFGELVFREKLIHSGIILNRLYELNTNQKISLVLSVIERHKMELHGSFTVIQPGKVRIRNLK